MQYNTATTVLQEGAVAQLPVTATGMSQKRQEYQEWLCDSVDSNG